MNISDSAFIHIPNAFGLKLLFGQFITIVRKKSFGLLKPTICVMLVACGDGSDS